MMNSLGSSLVEVLSNISRGARIILYTTIGIATVVLGTYEANHQYVEYFAMPRLSPSSERDEWGWRDQAVDESWSGTKARTGTDSRLGFKGRHYLRSAWMHVDWTSNSIFSSIIGNSTNELKGMTNVGTAAKQRVQPTDTMGSASTWMDTVIQIAADKGIALPNVDGVRAGLVSPEQIRDQLANVDPLVIALETKRASILERTAAKSAWESAASSYQNLLQVAAFSSDPGSAARQVRLATKIGDLKQALGEHDEAIEWAQRAVSLAGQAGSNALQDFPAASSTTQLPTPDHTASGAPLLSPTPTPGLTRALITALLSLSAMYAHSSTQSANPNAALQQALTVQSSALKLTSLEEERIDNQNIARTPATHLHQLWLKQHQAVLGLHLAETIYALGNAPAKKSVGSATQLKSLFGSKKKDEASQNETSLKWINDSLAQSERVIRELASHPESALRAAAPNVEDGEVASNPVLPLNTAEWKPDTDTYLFAQRLGRDALRLRTTAQRLRDILRSSA